MTKSNKSASLLSVEDILAIDYADLRVVLTLDDIYEDTGVLVV